MGETMSRILIEDGEVDQLWSIEHDPKAEMNSFRCGELERDTLIIFDWDDTLLCSSAITRQEWSCEELEELEKIVELVLLQAIELGDTIIVTNGAHNWVQESAKLYLPRLQPILRRLPIMSARSYYEARHPSQPIVWKKRAFEDVLKHRAAAQGRPAALSSVNLIVLGDSRAEILAAEHASQFLGAASIIKTVKFQEVPTVAELLGQLRRVNRGLEQIVCEDSGCDVQLRRGPFLQPADWAAGWSFRTQGSAKGTSLLHGFGLFCPSERVPFVS